MTDEKFEQLLHQALTPSVNDADILVNPPDRRKKMKKIAKIAACIAACMAFVVAAAKITQPKDALTTIVYANENGDNVPFYFLSRQCGVSYHGFGLPKQCVQI